MSVQTAKGLALRLRHFSREFRDARSMVSAESRIEIVRIVNRMSGCDGIPGNFLPLIIQAKVRDLMVDNNLWDLSLFVSLVGYMMPEVVSVTDGEKQRLALYCRAGLIALEWPEVFPDIFISAVDDLTDDEIENLGCNCLSENKFEIFGYYATACDLLAEWIENHADDDQGDPIPPGDGLQCDDTMFVWGGKTYTSITPAMGPLLKVLMRAYRHGRDATLPEFEAAAGEIKDGFGRCFDVGKHPNRSKHPVWKSIKGGRGKYRLIDPVKAKTGSR